MYQRLDFQKNGGVKMVPVISWREWFVPSLVIPAAFIILLVGGVIYLAQA
jgi:hypothetical protein